jgi:hypothetical protein
MKKPQSTRLPLWGQWAAGLALMLVALTAGGLSMGMNIAYGLQAGPAVAVAYGLSDAAKLLIPVVAVAIGWRAHLRLAAILAAIVSVWCAMNYLADQHGGQLLKRQHDHAVYAAAGKRIEELEARLKAAREGIAFEIANGGCGPKCRGHQDRADKISAELEAARDARAGMKPAELSGLAGWLALAGIAAKVTATQALAIVKTLAALVIVEVLAHLAGAAARLIGQAIRRRSRRRRPAKRGAGNASPASSARHGAVGGNVVPLRRPEERASAGLKSLTGL